MRHIIAGGRRFVAIGSSPDAAAAVFAVMNLYRMTRVLAGSLVARCLVAAAEPVPVTATAAPVEARQFDFWLGEWEITTPDGRLQGRSKVELIADGRGLLEQWTGRSANGTGSGRSLNTWNEGKQCWQQFWIGSDGSVLELSGRWEAAGGMVLTGSHEVGGRRLMERISWKPDGAGAVRQWWEQSADEGRTWKIVFEGHYRRKDGKVAGGRSRTRAMFYLFW